MSSTDFPRYDILASWRELQPPHFPLQAPTIYSIRLRVHQTDTIAAGLLRQLTVGFFALPNDTHELDRLLEIAKHASIISADLDQYLRSRDPKKQRQSKAPDIVLIKFTRMCVLHDILMLPDYESECDVEPERITCELCRLILLAYSLIVLAPVTTKSSLPQKIAGKLQRALGLVVDDVDRNDIRLKHPDLFLSAVIWGGMCAQSTAVASQDHELLGTFVDFLQFAAVKVEIHAWPLVSGIMKSYLWLEIDCEEPGQKFWAYASDLEAKS